MLSNRTPQGLILQSIAEICGPDHEAAVGALTKRWGCPGYVGPRDHIKGLVVGWYLFETTDRTLSAIFYLGFTSHLVASSQEGAPNEYWVWNINRERCRTTEPNEWLRSVRTLTEEYGRPLAAKHRHLSGQYENLCESLLALR